MKTTTNPNTGATIVWMEEGERTKLTRAIDDVLEPLAVHLRDTDAGRRCCDTIDSLRKLLRDTPSWVRLKPPPKPPKEP